MFLSINVWFTKLIRQFFFSIDKIVFNFISQIYDLLITIARTSVISQADILDMADRIYKLLAVFMIFKVTLSLITYVVNPDDFSDKSKGISKLGTNIIISLSLLILTPYIFNYAYQLQTIILEDNSLATLIFGEQAGNNFLNSAGDNIAFTTMSPFFTPNVSIYELADCVELTEKKENKIVFNTECSGMKSGPNYEAITSDKDSLAAVAPDDDVRNYVAGVENNNLGLMFREEMAIAVTDDDEYVMEYKFIFSTVVGVVVCLLLISFCMDVGVRSIKLAFLQLVAPIPIISYVDPKSGKDGLFKKWYEMCFKTYISLFVRLLALYFAVYIIGMVADMKLVDIVDGSYVTNKLVAIFIIIGALMFAKQLPKILEGLGIKLDGDGKFTLNPLKKFEEGAIGGKFLKSVPAAGLAGAAALGANALSSAQKFKNAKGWKAKTTAAFGGLGSTLAGGISATSRGIIGATKGEKFGKNFSNSYGIAMKNKQSRSDRIADNVGWLEMMGTKFTQTIGGHTKGEMVKSATETAKQIQSVYDSMMNAAKGNDKQDFNITIDGENRNFKGIKGLAQFYEQVSKTPIDPKNYNTQKEYLDAIKKQQDLLNEIDDAMKDRLNKIATGNASTQDDATTAAIREGFKQMKTLSTELNSVTDNIDSKIAKIDTEIMSAKDINGTAKGISNQITASTEASHATTVDQYAAKKKQN